MVISRRAVVHIHTAVEIHFLDFKPVAAEDMVIDYGAQEVVRRRDCVKVAGKMQVYIGHRHNLGIAAACRAALYAEHGAERRFTKCQAHLFAQLCHTVGKAD